MPLHARAIVCNAFLAFLVSGCSSDVLSPTAADPFEPPFDGFWSNETGQGLDIFVDGENSDLILSEYPVTVALSNSATDCVGTDTGTTLEFSGSMSFGEMTLLSSDTSGQECFRTSFLDLVTLQVKDVLAGTTTEFNNDRVQVALGTGVWQGNGLVLRFEGPLSVDNDSTEADGFENTTGCFFNDQVATDSFSGSMIGFNTDTREPPQISSLTGVDGTLLLSDLKYVDEKNITVVDDTGTMLSLKRVAAPAQGFNIVCP